MKTILFILIIQTAFILDFYPQEEELEQITYSYKTEEYILYRHESDGKLSEYMKDRCRMDLYYPENLENFPTVVWFHGGGMKQGSKYIPPFLKDQGIAVAAVNYRLYPEAKCPAYIEDAAASVAWIFKNIEKYNGDPDLIFIAGHSAGGYLASMVGLDKQWLAKYNIDADNLAGIIPFSGQAVTHTTIREERGIPNNQPIIDEYAPLYHVRKDAPPLMLLTGNRDMEIPSRYEENLYLWKMMHVVGHEQTTIHELDGFDHGTMVVPGCFLMMQFINEIYSAKQEL